MKLIDIVNKTKASTIIKELNIPKATLYRWLNHEGINKHVKFIKLLKYLKVDINEFLKEYDNKQ